MAIRPTEIWREAIAEEARLVAEGVLDERSAVSAKLFPHDLLSRMDQIIQKFEFEVEALVEPSAETVISNIQRVVVDINELNDDYDGDAIATGERDLLCTYIEEVLTEHGVDLDAVSEEFGWQRDELTDEWRTW